MATDVVTALLAVPILPARVLLVSEDAEVAAFAARLGVGVFHPPAAQEDPLNAALRAAADAAMAAGATTVLMVHADLPAVSAEALRALLAAHARQGDLAAPRATLVSDAAATGTNCMLLSPPSAMALRFGPGSRALHRAAAAAAGADYAEFMHPAIGFDVDYPADLDRLVHPGETQDNAPGVRTRAWVLEHQARSR
jgi:2-phospho-L-lactate guanylyltransferase